MCIRDSVRTLEERYWLNKNLYDEYCVYNADSAMNYVVDNLDIVYKPVSYTHLVVSARWPTTDSKVAGRYFRADTI